MKLFYLDNSHIDYVVVADDMLHAWMKLERVGVLPPDGWEDQARELYPAYNDLYEIEDLDKFDTNQLQFIL